MTLVDGVEKDVRDVFVKGVSVNDGEPIYPENGIVKIQAGSGEGTLTGVRIKGEGDSEILATIDNGMATLELTDLEVDELRANKLYLENKDIKEMLPNLEGLEQLHEIDYNRGVTIEELVENYNHLVRIIKGIVPQVVVAP